MGVVVLLFCVLQTHQGHKVSTEKREKTPREDKYTSYIQLASVIYKTGLIIYKTRKGKKTLEQECNNMQTSGTGPS